MNYEETGYGEGKKLRQGEYLARGDCYPHDVIHVSETPSGERKEGKKHRREGKRVHVHAHTYAQRSMHVHACTRVYTCGVGGSV